LPTYRVDEKCNFSDELKNVTALRWPQKLGHVGCVLIPA
jgi:hypothetical protein